MAIIPQYFAGDTVRFSVTFRDYPDNPEDDPETGDLLDPATVEVTIFNSDYVPVSDGVGLNESQGVYTFDFTMPAITETAVYYIEWKGLVNSKPEIKRDKFKVKFYVES